MRQDVLVKQIDYKGHHIYKHKRGSVIYYTVPALATNFSTLKAVKTALDKLDRDMSRMEKENRGGRRK